MRVFLLLLVLPALGCFANHGRLGPKEGEPPKSPLCEPACAGDPGAPVPYLVAGFDETNPPAHWPTGEGACLTLTHDEAFLEAGGNTLNLSAAADQWAGLGCGIRFCTTTSQFSDEPLRRLEGPSFQIHATAEDWMVDSTAPSVITEVSNRSCDGAILGVELRFNPEHEADFPDYLRALGYAMGLAQAPPSVESVLGSPRADDITEADAESLCAMYAEGYCD